MDKYFRDKDGKLTIFQVPNATAAIWLLSTIGARLIKTGNAHTLLVIASTLAAFIWAIMEITSGVNYFRKALGFVVLFFAIYSVVIVVIN